MNPYGQNTLRFYLRFNNVNSFGTIEICEPNGFSDLFYTIETENEKYARDISYLGGESKTVQFDGRMKGTLTDGIDELMETFNLFGFESDVEFFVEESGYQWILGNLDFTEATSNEVDKFTCNVIQSTLKQLIKRRGDVTIDLLGTENLDGEVITPIQDYNILLKAKPLKQKSKWESPNNINQDFLSDGSNGYAYFQNAQNLIETGIEGDKTFFQQVEILQGTIDNYDIASNYIYLTAQNNLVDITVNIIDLVVQQRAYDALGRIEQITGGFESKLIIAYGEELETATEIDVFNELILNDGTNYDDLTVDLLINESFQIDLLPIGHSIWIYFKTSWFGGASFLPVVETFIGNYSINISVTSIAIDSVTKAFRYIDVIKQCTKAINGFSVDAHNYDVGGKYYDTFIFDGNRIKNRLDVPMNVTYDDVIEHLKELNEDAQTLNDKIYIGHELDYYPNNEVIVFSELPSDSFQKYINERHSINQFNYRYSSFEQDDDEENTIDVVHAESEWFVPNTQVENVKEVTVKYIRDPFKIEKSRKEGFKKTTATNNDSQIFVVDGVQLAPNTLKTVTYPLLHNVNSDGNLELSNQGNFSWLVLGTALNSSFTISNSENSGTYIIEEYTDSIITLSGGNPTYTSQNTDGVITTFTYFLNNVQYTIRTNEDFAEINNIDGENLFANLKYTIKRNMSTWYNYLATCCRFIHDKTIKNTLFTNKRDSGNLETRLNTESELVVETADIPIIDLPEARLTPFLYVSTFRVKYDEAKALFEAYETINEDKTIGGFIRMVSNNAIVIKVYPQKLEYNIVTEMLSITGEEYNEGIYFNINGSNGLITINEVEYEISNFEVLNNSVEFYDSDGIKINMKYRFDFINLNGVVYDDYDEFLINLATLL